MMPIAGQHAGAAWSHPGDLQVFSMLTLKTAMACIAANSHQLRPTGNDTEEAGRGN